MVRPPHISAETCIKCKGSRLLCGKEMCPILMKKEALIPVQKRILSRELSGDSPPSFFVGRYGYPKVLAGPMVPPIVGPQASILDSPESWFGRDLKEIVRFRSLLVRCSSYVNVKNFWKEKNFLEQQEIAMASAPVGTECLFSREPQFRIDYDIHSPPFGPLARLEKMTITENTKIDKKVDYIVSDTDLKASDAVVELYEDRKVSVNQISRILSAGLLGIKKQRKLVPTRWSITATDDIASKSLIEDIKKYPEISEYMVFNSSYLDNHFWVLLIPSSWAFEQLEAWYPGSSWVDEKDHDPVIVADHEFYDGRKDYASNVTGAYYAARLAVAEFLVKIKRQAAAIVFREVRGGYIVPLGVWQIRENVRKALSQPTPPFEPTTSIDDSLKYIQLNIPIKKWVNASSLVEFLKIQKKITDFIHAEEKTQL